VVDFAKDAVLISTLDRQRVVDRLCAPDAGIAAPHGYIRGINIEYDRSVRVQALLRDLPPQDDYRISFSSGADERWVFMEKLAWDSNFFARGMARFDAIIRPQQDSSGFMFDTGPDLAALRMAIRRAAEHGIDYILGMVDAVDTRTASLLAAVGFELIEVRCHYHKPLLAAPEARYPTRLALAKDVPSLARAAREMVNPYDRFHVDPAIPPRDADRMMERWVEASILEGFADATIVPDVECPEAFCTAKYHRDHWEGWGLKLAQPVLSAVSPVHRGWYLKLISELNEHLRTVGAEHAFLVTQITNNAVIRCWEKLGFQFGKGEYVFRKLIGGG
jgi:hypothetical protein